jgi:hypothetical protein
MTEILVLLGIAALWFAVVHWVLPRLGISS